MLHRRAHVSEIPVCLCKCIICRIETGIFLQDGTERLYRLLVIATLEVDESEVVDGMEIRRVELQHTLKVGRGAVQILHLIAQQGTVEHGGGVVRLQLKRIVIIRHRSEIIVVVISEECPVHVKVGFLWLKAYRLVHICKSLVPLFARRLYFSAYQVGLEQRRGNLCGVVKVFHRLYGIAFEHTEPSTGGVSLLEPGIITEQTLEGGVCSRVTAKFRLRHRFIE